MGAGAGATPNWPDSSEPGGADDRESKTFDFGPLGPGASAEAVWKLSAVKAGHYTLLYRVDAGLSGTAKAKTEGGVAPAAPSSPISPAVPPDTEVTDSGEVVEAKQQRQRSEPGGE